MDTLLKEHGVLNPTYIGHLGHLMFNEDRVEPLLLSNVAPIVLFRGAPVLSRGQPKLQSNPALDI